MAGLTAAAVRVKASQPLRRRAGFVFTPTPRDLSREELGEGIESLKRICMIIADPALSVSFVDDDGHVHAVTDQIRAELEAYVAAEELRVDPENPPAPITELQTFGGSKPEAEGAAAPTGDGGEKAPDTTGSVAADPAKADEAAAASTEQAREQAGDAAADQKAASPEEHQPAETVPAPVAATDTPAETHKAGKSKRQAKDSADT